MGQRRKGHAGRDMSVETYYNGIQTSNKYEPDGDNGTC
jgi:hypothetical protein